MPISIDTCAAGSKYHRNKCMVCSSKYIMFGTQVLVGLGVAGELVLDLCLPCSRKITDSLGDSIRKAEIDNHRALSNNNPSFGKMCP